jgi:hypothetical protein
MLREDSHDNTTWLFDIFIVESQTDGKLRILPVHENERTHIRTHDLVVVVFTKTNCFYLLRLFLALPAKGTCTC